MGGVPEGKEIIWQGRPSHMVMLNQYTALFSGAVISIFLANQGLDTIVQLVPELNQVPEFLEWFPKIMWALAGLMMLMFAAIFINLQYTSYALTEDTIFTRTNFLRGDHDTLWVHLIRDVRAEMPLYLRIIGLGHVVIHSLDRTNPTLTLKGLREAKKVKNLLNDMARYQAAQHGVRGIDVG